MYIHAQNMPIKGTRSGFHFRPGSFLLMQVLRKEDQGWMVKIHGRNYLVKADTKLQPGRSYRTQALMMKKVLVLQIMDQNKGTDGAGGVLERRESILEGLIQVLKREGLSLHPEKLSDLRKTAKKNRVSSLPALRLLVLLGDKGIEPLSGFLENLLELGSPFSGKGEREKDQEPSPEQEEEEGAVEDEMAAEKESSEQKERFNLQWIVDKKNADALHLFNHIQGDKNHWLILPFEARYKKLDYSGSLRLLLDKHSYKPKKMTVITHTEDVSWAFIFRDLDKESRSMGFACNRKELMQKNKEKWKILEERLKAFGVIFEPFPGKWKDFDGFSIKNFKVFEGVDEII